MKIYIKSNQSSIIVPSISHNDSYRKVIETAVNSYYDMYDLPDYILEGITTGICKWKSDENFWVHHGDGYKKNHVASNIIIITPEAHEYVHTHILDIAKSCYGVFDEYYDLNGFYTLSNEVLYYISHQPFAQNKTLEYLLDTSIDLDDLLEYCSNKKEVISEVYNNLYHYSISPLTADELVNFVESGAPLDKPKSTARIDPKTAEDVSEKLDELSVQYERDNVENLDIRQESLAIIDRFISKYQVTPEQLEIERLNNQWR